MLRERGAWRRNFLLHGNIYGGRLLPYDLWGKKHRMEQCSQMAVKKKKRYVNLPTINFNGAHKISSMNQTKPDSVNFSGAGS